MRSLFLISSLLFATVVRADVAPLLNEVVEKWLDERSQWSFTQLVREYDGDKVVEERLERYDLSRGDAHRWELVKLNGHPPSADEEAAWSKRKNRPRKRDPKPLTEYIDLEHASVVSEDGRSVSYEVPLRRTAGWIFPGEKVGVTVTINKQSHALERGRINIDGPFNVALGLAKIVDLDFDLEMPAGSAKSGPAAQEAHGTAYAVVNKLGRRVEYSWSDFSRVPSS